MICELNYLGLFYHNFQTFLLVEPVVIGVDKTIERRRVAQIKAKGIYRNPVWSSKSHFMKARGLRWISMMLLVRISEASRFYFPVAIIHERNQETGARHRCPISVVIDTW